MTEQTKSVEDFMETAAGIVMEWADITPIAQALAEQYNIGFDAGAASAVPSKEMLDSEFQRGQDFYRDALLAQMDVATRARTETLKAPIAKSIEEAPAKPAGKDPPAVEAKVAPEPEKRTSAPAADQQTAKKSRPEDNPPRPAGIPTTFAMIREVLTDRPGLTSRETVQAIADKWWPGLQFQFLGPDISTNITRGRLSRDADGRLWLTDKGEKSESIDHRITQAGTRPVPAPRVEPPAEPRQVITPGAKLGPPARGSGSSFAHGGRSVLLHDREFIVAQKLRAARGAGHLDAKFLADQIGIKSNAEQVMRDFVSILNPKIATVGLVVEFFRGFGFIMKDLPQ